MLTVTEHVKKIKYRLRLTLVILNKLNANILINRKESGKHYLELETTSSLSFLCSILNLTVDTAVVNPLNNSGFFAFHVRVFLTAHVLSQRKFSDH